MSDSETDAEEEIRLRCGGSKETPVRNNEKRVKIVLQEENPVNEIVNNESEEKRKESPKSLEASGQSNENAGQAQKSVGSKRKCNTKRSKKQERKRKPLTLLTSFFVPPVVSERIPFHKLKRM
eukprot:Nk52_evm65s1992 gene=Nk52_evmTU65s1992